MASPFSSSAYGSATAYTCAPSNAGSFQQVYGLDLVHTLRSCQGNAAIVHRAFASNLVRLEAGLRDALQCDISGRSLNYVQQAFAVWAVTQDPDAAYRCMQQMDAGLVLQVAPELRVHMTRVLDYFAKPDNNNCAAAAPAAAPAPEPMPLLHDTFVHPPQTLPPPAPSPLSPALAMAVAAAYSYTMPQSASSSSASVSSVSSPSPPPPLPTAHRTYAPGLPTRGASVPSGRSALPVSNFVGTVQTGKRSFDASSNSSGSGGSEMPEASRKNLACSTRPVATTEPQASAEPTVIQQQPYPMIPEPLFVPAHARHSTRSVYMPDHRAQTSLCTFSGCTERVNVCVDSMCSALYSHSHWKCYMCARHLATFDHMHPEVHPLCYNCGTDRHSLTRVQKSVSSVDPAIAAVVAASAPAAGSGADDDTNHQSNHSHTFNFHFCYACLNQRHVSFQLQTVCTWRPPNKARPKLDY